MARYFTKKADIETLEITDVPMFSETDDQTGSVTIQEFNNKITKADGVIIATSEHNHTIPPSLNSLLERLSFNIHPLADKSTTIVGASYDIQGSSHAQLHLRQILDAPGVNATVMPGSEFLLGCVQTAFDENGNLKNQGIINFLESCFFRFLRFATIANQLNEPEEVRFEPGTHQVTIVGHNGDLPMSVTFSGERIEAIDINSPDETSGTADAVFIRVPSGIIEG